VDCRPRARRTAEPHRQLLVSALARLSQRHDVVGVRFVCQFGDDGAQSGDPVGQQCVVGFEVADAVVGVGELLPQRLDAG
jgi:hypothetical protein